MDLLFHYEQYKKQTRTSLPSYCEFRLYEEDNRIIYISTFDLQYHRWGVKKSMLYNYSFIISIDTGDIDVIHKIVNDKYNETGFHTTKTVKKQNDFQLLYDLVDNSIIRGEKRINYWGVKYNKAIEKMFDVLYEKLSPQLKTTYNKTKIYKEKYETNPFYDLIVDFHLDKKGIKGHDNVYNDIRYIYPKKKWLKLNEYKFLPSILDSLGIKTNHFVSKLNQSANVNVLTLNYLCKLFGDNFIDYVRQIDWESHCQEEPKNKKIHRLKNESEKNFMVSLINNWDKNTVIKPESLVYNINNLLSIREKLEKKGLDLKFKVNDEFTFEYTLENWTSIESHLKRGYKMKYNYPNSFVSEIEESIQINDLTFKPKLLMTEEDFRVEGYLMKNCMAKQFLNGMLYQYISLDLNKKRVNLQFKDGTLNQSYGKANTVVPDEFKPAIQVLEQRLKNYKNLSWSKEKYDFLN